MCLTLATEVHPTYRPIDMLRAIRPLLVRKKLMMKVGATIKWMAPYYDMEYEFGREYNSELKLETRRGSKYSRLPRRFNVIEEGLHSFRLHRNKPFYFPSVYTGTTLYVGRSYFPAIIPPGALFYVGDNNDIVSDKLIVYKNLDTLSKDWGMPLLEDAVPAHTLRAYHE